MLRRIIATSVLAVPMCAGDARFPALAGGSGDVSSARGGDANALEANRQEPAAAERARAMTEERLGDEAYSKADYVAALAHYEASLARMIAVRDFDPSNPAPQRFMALAMSRIGKTRDKLNDEPGALRIFGEALTILERLANGDPANDELQRERAVVHESRGGLLKKQGKNDEARAAYRAALGAYEDILARRPDDHMTRLYTVVPLAQLADLEPKLALKHIGAALAILREAKAAGRLDANRETWIASLEANLAELGGTTAGSVTAPQATGEKPTPASVAGREEKARTPPSPEARDGKNARVEKRPARATDTPVSDRNERPNKSPFDLY